MNDPNGAETASRTPVADAFSAVLAMADALGVDPEPCLASAWNRHEKAADPKRTDRLKPLVERPLTLLRRIFALLDQEPMWSSDELDWVAGAFSDHGWHFHEPDICEVPHCTHHHHARAEYAESGSLAEQSAPPFA